MCLFYQFEKEARVSFSLPIFCTALSENLQECLIASIILDWLVKRQVNKVALIITNVKSQEVLERWDFVVEYEGNSNSSEQSSDKPLKTIRNEIRDVLKQITSSVAFLPLLDCLCSFDIQIYTKNDIEMPPEWADAQQANIKNAQCVKMRSFSTNIHKMETAVTFKNDDDWLM